MPVVRQCGIPDVVCEPMSCANTHPPAPAAPVPSDNAGCRSEASLDCPVGTLDALDRYGRRRQHVLVNTVLVIRGLTRSGRVAGDTGIEQR
jgi:hypothetical protein